MALVVIKNPPANIGNSGDAGLIPASGRSPGEGNGHPLQYSWEIPGTVEPEGVQPNVNAKNHINSETVKAHPF